MKVLLTALLLLLPAISSFAQKEEGPSAEDYVNVDVEPVPLTPLHSLVVYPEAARRSGKEGQVIISGLIDETGNVTKVQIEKSSDPIFDEAAKLRHRNNLKK